MTANDLRKFFPSASIDFLNLNSGKAAVVERGAGDAALGKSKVQEPDSRRFLVRVTSIRKRLLDQSNLCYKYHEDLCRYAGCLPNDSPEICESQVRQRKAVKGEEEKTIVEVFSI